jgi:Yip1 domain
MSQIEDQMQGDAPAYGRPEGRTHQEPPSEPARLGPLQRFFGALFSPGPTFDDVNRKPTWIFPILIIILLSVAFTFFLTTYFAEGWQDFMRKALEDRASRSGQPMSEQDMADAIRIGTLMSYAIAIFGGVIYYLFLSGIFTLSMMFIQAQTTFKKIFSVVLWSAAATSAVQTIVMVASALTVDSESRREFNPRTIGSLSPTNLAAFLPSDTSSAVLAAASAIDIFSIWFLILLVIGFAAIGGSRNITTARTARMVFGLWVGAILLRAAWGALLG